MHPLLRVIFQRLGLGVLVLFAVSIIIFLGVELLPGDICEELQGQGATAETLSACRLELGLEKSPPSRYLGWLSNIVQGDFGKSLSNQREISDLIANRLSNTFFLAIVAAIISVPLSLVLGILAALYRNSWFDRSINTFTLSSISFPDFFVAYILIYVFAVQLNWFPSLSNISPDTPLLLTLVVVAYMMRMTRAAIINVMASPYLEMATFKGMSKSHIILKHALPNAWAPIVNVVVLNLAYLIVGVVVVEAVFVYPGLGQLMVDSVQKRDIPVVQACSIIFAATFVLLNLTADILSIISNPRLLHPR